MKLNLYSLKDTVVGAFGNIIPAEHDSVAVRNVSYVINHTDSVSFVKDKQLYCLGTFDNETGKIAPECRFIVSCVDLVNPFESKRKSEEVIADDVQSSHVIS